MQLKNRQEIDMATDPLRADSARHVVGMSVLVETLLDQAALRGSLEELASDSAFRLDGLSPAEPKGKAENDDTGHRGDAYEARFVLRATNGVAGDRQIFQVLASIASEHRWDDVEKILRFDV